MQYTQKEQTNIVHCREYNKRYLQNVQTVLFFVYKISKTIN